MTRRSLASSHGGALLSSEVRSAGDVVLSLMKRGVNSETVLLGFIVGPTFFKFERFFHGGRSALGMIRGFGAFLGSALRGRFHVFRSVC